MDVFPLLRQNAYVGPLKIVNPATKIVKDGAYGQPGSGPAAATLLGGTIQFLFGALVQAFARQSG